MREFKEGEKELDKLQRRIREVEEEYADAVVEQRSEEWNLQRAVQAGKIIGGLQTADRIADILSSETMRALIKFQEEKRHEDLGYTTFVECLETEMPGFTKDKFYRRKELLEKEGDQIFDIFNTIGLSARKRKLLGKGNVEIEGDTVIIRDGEEETAIELKDRTRILETLSALADANADKSAKIDRQKEKIEKHDTEKRELYEEIDRIKASKAAEIGQDPHSMALANACFALAALRDEALNLTTLDRAARKDNVLETLAGQFDKLRTAYRTDGTERPVEPEFEGTEEMSDQEFLDAALESVGDNDSELAGQL